MTDLELLKAISQRGEKILAVGGKHRVPFRGKLAYLFCERASGELVRYEIQLTKPIKQSLKTRGPFPGLTVPQRYQFAEQLSRDFFADYPLAGLDAVEIKHLSCRAKAGLQARS